MKIHICVKVSDYFLYVIFFTYHFQIVADGGCLCIVSVLVILIPNSVNHTLIFCFIHNNE